VLSNDGDKTSNNNFIFTTIKVLKIILVFNGIIYVLFIVKFYIEFDNTKLLFLVQCIVIIWV